MFSSPSQGILRVIFSGVPRYQMSGGTLITGNSFRFPVHCDSGFSGAFEKGFGRFLQEAVADELRDHLFFLVFPSGEIYKAGKIPPGNTLLFLSYRPGQSRQEPSDNGCHYPYDNSNCQRFEPAYCVQFLQCQQPHDSRYECSYQTLAYQIVYDSVHCRANKGGEKCRGYAFCFAKQLCNNINYYRCNDQRENK